MSKITLGYHHKISTEIGKIKRELEFIKKYIVIENPTLQGNLNGIERSTNSLENLMDDYYPLAKEFELKASKPNILEQIYAICDKIEYSRHVPEEAKKLAKENNIIIIVGGSDDLMYCYGAECYLTEHREHSYGSDGDTLKSISDPLLEEEARQLGLMIWWCGEIKDAGFILEGYDTNKSGAFSYTVKENINSLDFLVMEDESVYCTGKIIQLPEDFVSFN